MAGAPTGVQGSIAKFLSMVHLQSVGWVHWAKHRLPPHSRLITVGSQHRRPHSFLLHRWQLGMVFTVVLFVEPVAKYMDWWQLALTVF